jgi:hypothetical protein
MSLPQSVKAGRTGAKGPTSASRIAFENLTACTEQVTSHAKANIVGRTQRGWCTDLHAQMNAVKVRGRAN